MTNHELILRRDRSNRLITVLIVAITTMLFAAFTGAYLIRRTGADWSPVRLPGILVATTAVIVLSSVVLEAARRRDSSRLLLSTLGLAVLFLVGQLVAWRQLADAGLASADVIHGMFISILCAVHAVHLIGGIIALTFAIRRPALLSAVTMWWHFVGIVWLYVYVLLSIG